MRINKHRLQLTYEKEKYLTVKEFAGKMEIDRLTLLRWLKQGPVPDAQLMDTPAGISYWQIPEHALKMERPRAGRKKPQEKWGKR